MKNLLKIKNAKVHNLKNISLDIPKDSLIVFTGVSGSGKSSLAFDTIYAEGQRRYVESLSSYARQFLGMMEKPDVEHIDGLSPAISIDQKSASHNPRSTVGTVTEIYDYLRLLFARIGKPYDPATGKLLESQTVQQIVNKIINSFNQNFLQNYKDEKIKVILLASLVKNRKGTYEELFQRLISKGFARIRVDGKIYNLDEEIKLDRYKIHNIDLVVDRLVLERNIKIEKDFEKRVTDSVELSLNMSEGAIIVNYSLSEKESIDIQYTENFVLSDGTSFPKLEPNLFSFNAPQGACTICSGLGKISEISEELVYNPNLSIDEGGIYPISRMWDTNTIGWYRKILETVCRFHGIDTNIEISKLHQNQIHLLMYGTEDILYKIITGNGNTYNTKFEGIIPMLLLRYKQTESDYIRREIEQYMNDKICPTCNGKRLKKESEFVKIDNKNIIEITSLTIQDAKYWIDNIQIGNILSENEKIIAKQVLKELSMRLNFLLAVGLDYLTLSRTAKTLSGGEAQRIRLASQIGTGLSGVLYVLDEPSIGLHQRDNARLIETLKNLRDLGNTVIVVEHDEETILNADWITDIGPLAGEKGGEVVFNGTFDNFKNFDNSLTSKYINKIYKIDREEILRKALHLQKDVNDLEVEQIQNRKKNFDKSLTVIDASENNLKNITVKFPLNKFICVTGVSGSGKSTLVNDILASALYKYVYTSKIPVGKHKMIQGIENIDKVVIIDQSPIGRTPRSNPATYVGVFNYIRELYASTKESKVRGYGPGRFSFNTKGGRCEKCRGDGLIKIEMQFLPDVYVTCEECKGKRYNKDTLSIDFKEKTIADVLDMSVEEAVEFFENISYIKNKLATLNKVGLGYIKLGQSATTLSGGEAQRVKLATELSKKQTGKTVYILDEPTTGLHFYDIEKLLIVLHSLVLKGNTVIAIEHNLDFIKTADWIIDMGPEGGNKGGEILAEGTVQDIENNPKSYTGIWLKKKLI